MQTTIDRIYDLMDQLDSVESGTDQSFNVLTELDQAFDQMFKETDQRVKRSRETLAQLGKSLDMMDALLSDDPLL